MATTSPNPWLALAAPLSNIRITLPRYSDVDDLQRNLSDHIIYSQLARVPYPYTREHAAKWLQNNVPIAEKLLSQAQDVSGSERKTWVDGCPYRVIREVTEDGEERYIGDIGVRRADPEDFGWFSKVIDGNLEKEVGDPTIIWTLGSESRSLNCADVAHISQPDTDTTLT